MIENHIPKLFHQARLGADPPVPPLRVPFLVVIVWLDTVVHRVHEACVGWKHVHWAAHAQESLVAEELDGVGNQEWVVRLDNPYAVVPHILALKPLDLQRSGCVQVHGATRRDSRNLFKDTS